MDEKVILEVKDIVSGYISEIDVIRGVSFNVKRSEIFSMIGPNGAGKSTVLKTIFGLLKVRSGSIFFYNTDITDKNYLGVLREGIAYVPQGRCNFPAMTVKENLEMGAVTRDDDEVEKDIKAAMDLFPVLREREDELAGNLSGGQQQILEMGMALTVKPEVLLLDEPTLGLAPKIVSQIFEQILEINKRGTTLIMVEQNAKKALSISDHAIVLELGKKRFEGTGEEIASSEEVKELYLGGRGV